MNPPNSDPRIHLLTLPDGRQLAYAEWGDPHGFPAFYFHGTPGSRLEGALAERAAGKHRFRLIAPDRPGFGRSTFQKNRRLRDWPNDIRSLADALGVREFGIVGHSGAGPHLFACGCFIAAEQLKFIGALGPWGPVAAPEVMASLNALDRRYAKLAQHTPTVMRAGFAPLGWCAKYWPHLFFALMRSAVSPADRTALRNNHHLAEILRRSEAEAFRQGSHGGAHEAFLEYRDWGFDITKIDVPTHIWLGDRDSFVSREMGRHLERGIPGVDFHWLEGGGHFEVESWDDILAACATDISR